MFPGKRYLSRFVLLVFSLLILAHGIKKPLHNWDMIGYVAAAYYEDGLTGKQLADKTYQDIRAEVDDRTFADLTDGNYRHTVYADPASLAQQLPFYTNRVGYVEVVRIFHAFGVTYPKSTILVSAVFSAGAVVLMGMICLTLEIPEYWALIAALLGGFVENAQLSTPDSAACFFSILALYFCLRKDQIYLLVAVLLPFFRTDYAVLSVLLGAYAIFYGKKWLGILSITLSVIFYFLINRLSGNYGLLELLNFELIGITPYPRGAAISHHLIAYLKPYGSVINDIWKSRHFTAYVIGLYIFWINFKKQNLMAENLVLGLALLFVVLHLLIFPVYFDRYFSAYAAVIFTMIVSQIAALGKGRLV